MEYTEALEWINKIGKSGSKLGLSRTYKLLELMGNPQDKLKFVHVAGTNGKGSVSACIAEVLHSAGYRTGLYTSPHLVRLNERFKINFLDVEDEALAARIAEIKDFSERLKEEASQFELLTALAFKYFYEEACDIVVLETGLGGRLDSTNVIKVPEIAVITTIDMDHINELGDSIEKIALEKAGIIKEGADVVIDARNPKVMDVFKKVCEERSEELNMSDLEEIKNLRIDFENTSFDYKNIKGIRTSLLGLYQPGNIALAIEALEVLKLKSYKISEESILEGLLNVRWQARFELLSREPYFIVDGSHNPAGVRETLRSIEAYFSDKKVRFILGILSDKNIDEILGDIKEYAVEIAIITPPSDRACKSFNMLDMLRKKCEVKSSAFEDIGTAVKYMLKTANKEDIICATGSLYSVSEIKKQFRLYKS